jgi:hypothetical protein
MTIKMKTSKKTYEEDKFNVKDPIKNQYEINK